MHVLISTQRELSVGICLLSVLHFDSLSSLLYDVHIHVSNSMSPSFSIFIPLLCTSAWKLPQVSKFGHLWGSYNLYLASWRLMFFVACCPVSWKSTDIYFLPFMLFYRQECKSSPFNSMLSFLTGNRSSAYLYLN